MGEECTNSSGVPQEGVNGLSTFNRNVPSVSQQKVCQQKVGVWRRASTVNGAPVVGSFEVTHDAPPIHQSPPEGSRSIPPQSTPSRCAETLRPPT